MIDVIRSGSAENLVLLYHTQEVEKVRSYSTQLYVSSEQLCKKLQFVNQLKSFISINTLAFINNNINKDGCMCCYWIRNGEAMKIILWLMNERRYLFLFEGERL